MAGIVELNEFYFNDMLKFRCCKLTTNE